jgi:homocysteine S-methyltransferase
MAKYRNALPQLGEKLFLAGSGLETSLIFHDGMDLPHFASFVLLVSPGGRQRLRSFYAQHAKTAVEREMGFILDTPTWRANPDWARKLGFDAVQIDRMNRAAVSLASEMRQAFETPKSPMVMSGTIGPRGEGYHLGQLMEPDEARDYHRPQIDSFRSADADMVSAFTINNVPEAVGIIRAAQDAGMPSTISWVLETDGNLPSGQSLRDAIELTDRATDGACAYFGINCAHPTHFEGALVAGEDWTKRVRALRANASTRSHAELETSTKLDAGNPAELGRQYRDLRGQFRHITLLGGCCGTDHRHVSEIARACAPVEAISQAS